VAEITVVASHYRLAPENKAPAGIMDGYANLKWVIDNADALNIDKNRIAIMGESGGGWITAGVAMMLAERNESHLVRFHMPCIPENLSNVLYRGEPDSYFNFVELGQMRLCRELTELIAPDKETAAHDMWVHPACMPDELAKKLPPAILMTCEFDMYRKCAEEYGELMKKHDKFIGIAIIPGQQHNFPF